MEWNKKQNLDENVVVVGGKHYMNYAFSIAVRCHLNGYCKVHIEKGRVWTNRLNGGKVSVEDNWKSIIDFISRESIGIKIVREEDDGKFRKVTLEW